MHHVFDAGIDAYIADTQFRKRDPRFTEADRYKVRARRRPRHPALFRPADSTYDETERTCTCPAGKRLYRQRRQRDHWRVGRHEVHRTAVSLPVLWVARSMPEASREDEGASGGLLQRPIRHRPETFTHKMKRKIDSPPASASTSDGSPPSSPSLPTFEQPKGSIASRSEAKPR